MRLVYSSIRLCYVEDTAEQSYAGDGHRRGRAKKELDVFLQAMKNATPLVEVKPRRVVVRLTGADQYALRGALRWL